MKRPDLEHIIRASAAITGADEVVIIGSQAILAQFPDAPKELLISEEADVFTFRSPEDADLIDGSIGEGSPFHCTFGYYAHGVAEETAVLPEGWKTRLVKIQNANTGSCAGLSLEIHDLAASKLAAGREKDLDYVNALIVHNLINLEKLKTRINSLPDPCGETSLNRLKRLLRS